MKNSTVYSRPVSRELEAMKETKVKTDYSLPLIIGVLVAVFGTITAFCVVFGVSNY